ncbi:MAG: HEAT repeat domain-containing protein [Myxococcales bacterium]|nr:HEAT repeat domain-containing protein [Myxococcales bacterium]
MPTLSSAIVKAHVASMREVEEALARQVIYGGDLVTNLLELALVSEHLLTPLLADSHGLEPAPHGELPRATDALMSLVPPELAGRHAFYPLDEVAGILTIAVSEPLPAEVEGDLSFSLGARIEQRSAPLVRIRQALSRDYGVPLDRRMVRLLAKLEGRPDPSPSSMPAPLRDGSPPFPKLPRPASMPPIGYPPAATLRSSEPALPIPPVAARPPSVAPELPPRPAPVADPDVPARVTTLITPRHPAERTAPESEAPRWLVGTPGRERGRKRHRGPYTAALAERDLMDADSRDDVVGAYFDFASQYFEYSALFAVQGDVAEGRDAHGPGTDGAKLRSIGVPLDLPSSLSDAKTSGTFLVRALDKTGIDASLSKDLQRESSGAVLLLPLVVRGRVVLVLYGDHGTGDVPLSEVGDVIAFAPLVATALERVILRKKLGARASSSEMPAVRQPFSEAPQRRRHRLPNVDQRVDALAKALDSTRPPSRPPSEPPTTTHASPAAKGFGQSGPATVSASPRALAAPITADASPKARGVIEASVPTQSPSTPHESPQAKARASTAPARVVAVGAPRRHDTPPQGTPGTLDATQEQPFPLTRRTPSGRFFAGEEAPRSSETEAAVDAGWDVQAEPEADPGTHRGPFGPPEPEQKSDVGHEAPLAPASRQLALGPRPPFPRQDAKDHLLPSVIFDIDSDLRTLLVRLVEGDEGAGDRLVEIGDPAVSVLVAEFPGPVHPDRARRFAEPGARASDAGPVLRTIARIGQVAVAFLVVRTADREPDVRRWATWLLGELPNADSARAIVRRFSDGDAEVRRAALAAGKLMQADAEARTALRDGLATLAAETSLPPEVRHSGIEALADLRDPRAVPRLIPLLGTDDAAVVRSAHAALVTIARQDFGREGKRWSAWWQENSARHRVEWLIDALAHDSLELRRAAGEELKSVTKEYFGYYEDLPAKERQRAQLAYRQWWEATGKARFS